MTLALLLLAASPGTTAVEAVEKLPASFTMNDAGWEQVEVDGEVTVERRDVPGSPYPEFRTSALTAVPVEPFCAAIYEWASVTPHDELKTRRLLKDGARERLTYDQLQIPVVSNRDYTMVVRRSQPGAAVCHVWFWTVSGVEPAHEGFVRMDKMRGSWEMSAADGGTLARYTLFADPGGSIPSVVVRPSQKQTTIDTLRAGTRAAKAGVKGEGAR